MYLYICVCKQNIPLAQSIVIKLILHSFSLYRSPLIKHSAEHNKALICDKDEKDLGV